MTLAMDDVIADQIPWAHEQCRARGVALSHTLDMRERPTGRCLHCHTTVIEMVVDLEAFLTQRPESGAAISAMILYDERRQFFAQRVKDAQATRRPQLSQRMQEYVRRLIRAGDAEGQEPKPSEDPRGGVDGQP